MFNAIISCDQNTTNFVESFNACTKAHRDLHVLNLLEGIHYDFVFFFFFNYYFIHRLIFSSISQPLVSSMKRIDARFDKDIDIEPGHQTYYSSKVLETRNGNSRLCHATPYGGG